MPRLIWVFAGRTVILLVLSWGGLSTVIFSGAVSNAQDFKSRGYELEFQVHFIFFDFDVRHHNNIWYRNAKSEFLKQINREIL